MAPPECAHCHVPLSLNAGYETTRGDRLCGACYLCHAAAAPNRGAPVFLDRRPTPRPSEYRRMYGPPSVEG